MPNLASREILRSVQHRVNEIYQATIQNCAMSAVANVVWQEPITWSKQLPYWGSLSLSIRRFGGGKGERWKRKRERAGVACEQALLFGRVKRVSRERASERRSEAHFAYPNRRACSQANIGAMSRRFHGWVYFSVHFTAIFFRETGSSICR